MIDGFCLLLLFNHNCKYVIPIWLGKPYRTTFISRWYHNKTKCWRNKIRKKESTIRDDSDRSIAGWVESRWKVQSEKKRSKAGERQRAQSVGMWEKVRGTVVIMCRRKNALKKEEKEVNGQRKRQSVCDRQRLDHLARTCHSAILLTLSQQPVIKLAKALEMVSVVDSPEGFNNHCSSQFIDSANVFLLPFCLFHFVL